jgi:hypothetical protein
VTVEYLDLADFLVVAEEITGIEVPVLTKMSRLSLADSALHAPQAGYGDVDIVVGDRTLRRRQPHQAGLRR